MMKPCQSIKKSLYKIVDGTLSRQVIDDTVPVEEPLQIFLDANDDLGETHRRVLTLTMRTPGDDQSLAVGLLKAEGIIQTHEDIVGMNIDEQDEPNQLVVTLTQFPKAYEKRIERHFISHSSCGLCGKTSLQALELNHPPNPPTLSTPLILSKILDFPQLLKQQQLFFQKTGGIHAAGIFTINGEVCQISEDIGRHNALDKAIGHQLMQAISSKDKVIVLSGRASFELLQKAVMAGYAVVISVGAPSSLAISVAQRFDVTLIGFVKQNSCNVYSGEWRIGPECRHS